MKKKKISFLLNNFNYGGAEINYINFVNYLNPEKYEVSIISLNNIGGLKNRVSKNIILKDCKSKKLTYSILKIVKYVKELNPDYIFTSLPHFNIGIIIISKFFLLKPKIIIREANVVDPIFQDNKFKNFIFILLKRITYKYAYKIITITNTVKDNLINYQKIKSKNFVTIYNPIINNYLKPNKHEDTNFTWIKNYNEPILIAVGRLVRQKNFTCLIYAFSKLKNNTKKKLIIIGSGIEKKNLISLTKKLNLLHNIHFIESSNNINFYLKYCSVFVCSSLWEGTPNVLVEALRAKIPVVCSNFPSAYELLNGSSNFRIAKRNDSNDLSIKINEIISDLSRSNFNNQWKNFTIDNFSLYESLINNIYNEQ